MARSKYTYVVEVIFDDYENGADYVAGVFTVLGELNEYLRNTIPPKGGDFYVTHFVNNTKIIKEYYYGDEEAVEETSLDE